jgi:thiol:disulfide interchange protein
MIEINTGVFVKTKKPNNPGHPRKPTDVSTLNTRSRSFSRAGKAHTPRQKDVTHSKKTLHSGQKIKKWHYVVGFSSLIPFLGLPSALFSMVLGLRFIRQKGWRLVLLALCGLAMTGWLCRFFFEANAGTNIPELTGSALSHSTPLPQSRSNESAQALNAIRWRDPEEGFKEAKRTKRPLLLDFTAEWCGWCHRLENDVLGKPEVIRYINQHYIPVKVMDRMREEGKNSPLVADLQTRFGVRGFPTLAVTRSNFQHSSVQRGYIGDPQLMLSFLSNFLDR